MVANLTAAVNTPALAIVAVAAAAAARPIEASVIPAADHARIRALGIRAKGIPSARTRAARCHPEDDTLEIATIPVPRDV